jgi:Na+/H+ antiporter NhaD/arsenite permease-like protein
MLRVHGASLGLHEPWQFFWASGTLSSFLDNAPTYAVFFETANSLTNGPGQGIMELAGGRFIRLDLLAAVSLGSVFMGANTYIGNGPNFMVKAIAEERGIKMPSFFGYMLYSVGILIPIFLALTFVFFVLKWV